MNIMRVVGRSLIPIMVLLSVSTGVVAQGDADPATALQRRWDTVNYDTAKNQQAAAFDALAVQARSAAKAYPQQAPVLIWTGVVLASAAGAHGGLGALSLAKEAKQDLEAALAIDPTALGGAAYTSLGSLYYQVPGWPLGFGSSKKARAMLEKGLAINPDDIDANYFYGDFLRDQGDYAQAREVLEKALAAPPRAGREVADAGRRKEIQSALAKVEAKLAKN